MSMSSSSWTSYYGGIGGADGVGPEVPEVAFGLRGGGPIIRLEVDALSAIRTS